SRGGGALKVQSPQRLLDTREPSQWSWGAVETNTPIRLRVAGRSGVPLTADAAMVTVTVANPLGDGFVTTWPCDEAMPTASTVNTWAAALRSNFAIVKLSASGDLCLMYRAANLTSTDIVVDAVGWATGNVSRTAPTDIGGLLLPGSSTCAFRTATAPVSLAFCDTFTSANPN